MKRKIKYVIFLSVVIAFAAASSFFFTLFRYVNDEPVAKVKILKICQAEGGTSRWGIYSAGNFFANVKIISIDDDAAFRQTALRISKDGKRANLDFAKGLSEVGKEYDCYGKHSLRGKGIASWWSGFGYYWRNAGCIFFLVCIIFVGVIAFYQNTCIRRRA